MKLIVIIAILLCTPQTWGLLEPDLEPADEGRICPTCGHTPPIEKPAAKLQSLPAPGLKSCGTICEKLLAAAKIEGTRCPYIFADFKAAKYRVHRGSDACAFYRAHGKDPTQWSKGRCATAIYNDFVISGFKVPALGAAHMWNNLLRQPKYNMQLLDVKDPKDAPRGAILVYSSFGGRGPHAFGHVEVKVADNNYCSDYCYPVDFLTKAPSERGHLLGVFMPKDG